MQDSQTTKEPTLKDFTLPEESLATIEKIKEKAPQLVDFFNEIKAKFSTPYTGPVPCIVSVLQAMNEAMSLGIPPEIVAASYVENKKVLSALSREDLEHCTIAASMGYANVRYASRNNGFPKELQAIIEKAAADGKLNVVTDNETAAHLRGEGVDLGAEASKETLN
jgi:hypothetical protein